MICCSCKDKSVMGSDEINPELMVPNAVLPLLFCIIVILFLSRLNDQNIYSGTA